MRARPKLRWVRANSGYPELSSRKRLVGHLLIARAQATHLYALDGQWERWERTLRESTCSEAGDYSRMADNNYPLSAHIGAILNKFNSKAPPQTEDASLARLLYNTEYDSLRDDVARIDCKSCAGQRPICNGDNRIDAANMKRRPECWTRVDELVNYAVQNAEAAYSRLFRASSTEMPVEVTEIPVEVKVSVLQAGNGGLGGSLTFPPSDSLGKRCAEMIVWLPEQMTRDDYLQSLYVIFHEIFVHSVQALGVSARRPVFDELCEFTEGFVDRAAERVLCAALKSAALKSDPARPFSNDYLRQRFVTEARRAHFRRTDATNASDSETKKAAQHRLAGYQLFENVDALLENEDFAVQVAMYLNLRLGTRKARNEMYNRLGWLAIPEKSSRRQEIRRALMQFATDGEWSNLARSLKFESGVDP
jgi:hypothetical protein